MAIDFANLNYQYRLYKTEIDAAIQAVLDCSCYIMGPPVQELEAKLAEYTGARHCITCASGTDALQLGMMALDIGRGDEVITTPFTFIATAEMIAHLGARPVFVDIDASTYNIDAGLIERAISSRTKAIMPVSLYGQPADMNEIAAVAAKHDLPVIEDAAQSFGATYHGRQSGNLSEIGCTSFFPAKPLGCYGDGGAVFTSNDAWASKIQSMRVHGQQQRYCHLWLGVGARMDTLQAAVLLVKLRHYSNELTQRQQVAARYSQLLASAQVITPEVKPDRTSAWAQYSIRVKQRDRLQTQLKAAGIPTAVHYPIPLHLQPCFAYLGQERGAFPVAEAVSNDIISLPMNPFIRPDEQALICQKIDASSANES